MCLERPHAYNYTQFHYKDSLQFGGYVFIN